MARLERMVLVRHGETDGESSIRFHGSGDVALSALGRAHMREAARRIHHEGCSLVVASPLQRAWQAAVIVAPGRTVVLEADFREIDFGRWEGLTAEEIEARDPELFARWQADPPNFDFPDGERRVAFRDRVDRGLERLAASGHSAVLVVAHKGIVRRAVAKFAGTDLPADEPRLGGAVHLTRRVDGSWRVGRRSSNPAAIGDAPDGLGD